MAQMNALGINIFGGGFTLGVRRAGFRILGQWEECNAGARTFDLNTQYFGGIHRPLRYGDWPLLEVAHPHLIYANPPCAPWSAANTRLGRVPADRLVDPRLAMTKLTMETAMVLKPEVFVCESVARAYTLGRSYYDAWAERWLALGYGVTYYLTDALLCGLPSTRNRFHFITHRNELVIDEPRRDFIPKTTASVLADIQDDFGHLTGHVPKRFSPEVHAQMEKCEEGRELREVGEACAKWSFLYRKLVWDAPGFTVINLEMLVHPRRPRLITKREGLRLCGYPDDFGVVEMPAATQAVMPTMGEHLALIAARSIDSEMPADRELVIVDHRPHAKPYTPGAVRAAMNEEFI